jgi:cytochrome c5
MAILLFMIKLIPFIKIKSMKKLIIATLGISIFFSCAKKNVPTASVTTASKTIVANENKETNTNVTTKISEVDFTKPNPNISSATAVAPAMAETQTPTVNIKPTELVLAGEQTYKARCGKCHELKEPQIYNAPKWVKVVEWMGPRAKLDATQKDEVIAYLSFYAKK